MTELLGMPFEVALAVVVLNGLFYLAHHLLGDPVVPGWITPAIPLLMAYCSTFFEGPERVHALVAFQMMLGIFSILIGATGMAHRVVQLIPAAIKASIIVGAGFAAVISVSSWADVSMRNRFTSPLLLASATILRHFARIKNSNPVLAIVESLVCSRLFCSLLIYRSPLR